ncbi:MAG: hypothetical protein ABIR71_05965 [Chthoniobacterales bacterium]
MLKKLIPLLCVLAFTLPLFAAEVPAEEELEEMTLEALLAFNTDVQKGDFTDFQATMAKKAQEQLSMEKLNASFHEFVENKINFASIKNLEPDFETTEIDKDGILIVKGTYPTTPVILQFRLRFLQEEGEWKLFGINVDTKQDSPDAPQAQKKEVD